MTASGSFTLMVILLALVVAATGYAGGRIHQWWRAGRDRDKAYRDGYDTATRSVFSLAARVIGPRRPAARGSATVGGALPDGAVLIPLVAEASPALDGLVGSSAGSGPVGSAAGSGPAMAGAGVSHVLADESSSAGASPCRPLSAAETSPDQAPAVMSPYLPWSASPGMSPSLPSSPSSGADLMSPYARTPAGGPSIPLSRSPGGSALVRSNSASHFITDRPPASAERDGDVVPLVVPVHPAVAGPAVASGAASDRTSGASVRPHAAGPVTVPAPRREPDQAPMTDTQAWSPGAVPPIVDDPNEWWRSTETSVRDRRRRARAAAHEAASGSSSGSSSGSGSEQDVEASTSAADSGTESTGRHTVPDELVRAATYRLPPDRVFRAKVPQPTAEDRSKDPTTRLPEPPATPN